MGKYVYAVLMVFTIEFALWLFTGAGHSSTSLFGILFDPTTLISNPLYIAIGVTLLAFAASAIIPLNTFQINIYALYAGLAVAFISFSLSIVHLWQFIYGELSGITTQLAIPITTLIVAPILAYYLISTVEWVRGN